MKPVVIFGTGDYARVACVTIEAESERRVEAFTVHEQYVPDGGRLLERAVVAFDNILETHPPDRFDMLVAMGFGRVNKSRAEVVDTARGLGYHLITHVSPHATIAPSASIGENTFVFENNVIQPFVKIGDDVVLWSGNHIGHDSIIEDHCFVASHVVVSGNVRIGHHTFIGVNATIRDGIVVAPHGIIGAGALVMKDTAEGAIHSVRGTPELADRRSWDLTNF